MRHTLNNQKLTIEVSPLGAELQSIQSSNGQQFLWQGEAHIWNRRAPNLFPHIGELNGNQYKWQGQLYSLSRHGFARDSSFTLIQASGNSLSYQLKSNQNSFTNYPFHFTLNIHYTLEKNNLKITYEVFNQNNHPMPFSIGGHPAFVCPIDTWVDGKKDILANWVIEFEKQEYLQREYLAGEIRSGRFAALPTPNKVLKLYQGLFDQGAIILKEFESNWIKLKHTISNQSITLNCSEFPYLGIWSKAEGGFICLEPWQGLTSNKQSAYRENNLLFDLLQKKEGIVNLSPHSQYSASYTLTFESP